MVTSWDFTVTITRLQCRFQWRPVNTACCVFDRLFANLPVCIPLQNVTCRSSVVSLVFDITDFRTISHGFRPRAPKQWQLTKNKTVTSYEGWRRNILHILTLGKHFEPHLESTWLKKTAIHPHRVFSDNGGYPREQFLPRRVEEHVAVCYCHIGFLYVLKV